jgi:hypothetical protein
MVAGLVLAAIPMSAPAWDFEAHGTLEPGDPVFNRPSTSFPPCALSSNGTAVYYDVHTGTWPGGYGFVAATGTVNRPVLATYPAGTFNPASPCDNILGAGGCEPLPFAVVGPVFGAPGTYDIVVTHCYNGDSGSYDIYMEAVLFGDGFQTGDLDGWSASVP